MENIGWNFPDNNNGSVNGISEAGIETFKGNVFQALAREICQNSLDARLDNKKPVRIDFQLSNIDVKDIPDVERLKEVFTLSKQYWNNNKKAVNFYENAINTINSEKLRLLRISDFNTIGLMGAEKEKNSDWINLVKSSGVSSKTGTAGGSYGIGKNAPFACSDLRIIYYSTFDKEGIRAYQGVAKLASFEEKREKSFWRKKEKIITQGTGFYGNMNKNLPVFDIFSLDGFKRNIIGTDIYVLGFINDNNWTFEMIKSVLSSYLLSIYYGDLEVKIGKTLIDKANLSDLVQEYGDDLTKEYYRVLYSPNTVHKEKKFADLGNITLDILIEKGLKKRRVLMARGNGMKVFDKNRISGSMEFSAICILKDEKIDEYFRLMETPQHDKWEPDRHPDKKEARKKEKELSRFIKDEIKDLGRSTVLDEMDAVGASEYLPDEGIGTVSDEQNKQESLLNKTSSISPLKKIEIVSSSREGTQFIDEKDIGEGSDDIGGELSEDSDLSAVKKHNKNCKSRGFNVCEFFGISSDKDEVLVKNSIKIEPLKFRLFLYDKQNKRYKLTFIPKISSYHSYIEIFLMGEQGGIPARVKNAHDNKRNLLCKKDKIYIGDLTANEKYTIFYFIDNEELCSMEVSIRGYNK